MLYTVLYYCQCSTCFRWCLRPSSGAQNFTHSIWHMSSLLAVTTSGSSKQAWHIPNAVCTVLNSWWWVEEPPETCRALTVIKNIVQRYILLVILKRKRNGTLVNPPSTAISHHPPLFCSPDTANNNVPEIYSQLNGTYMHFSPILYAKLVLLINGIKRTLKIFNPWRVFFYSHLYWTNWNNHLTTMRQDFDNNKTMRPSYTLTAQAASIFHFTIPYSFNIHVDITLQSFTMSPNLFFHQLKFCVHFSCIICVLNMI
jgi:hypothetical protein